MRRHYDNQRVLKPVSEYKHLVHYDCMEVPRGMLGLRGRYLNDHILSYQLILSQAVMMSFRSHAGQSSAAMGLWHIEAKAASQ